MLTHLTREPLKLNITEGEIILGRCLGVAQSEASMTLGFSFHRWKILAATCEALLYVAEHHDRLDILLLDHPPELGTRVTSVLIWRTFRTLFSLISSLSIGLVSLFSVYVRLRIISTKRVSFSCLFSFEKINPHCTTVLDCGLTPLKKG